MSTANAKEAASCNTDQPVASTLTEAAQDWVTLWQSEWTAIAADRELRETWQLMVAFWAGAATVILRSGHLGAKATEHASPTSGRSGRAGKPARSARTPDATGPAATASAPDVGVAEIEPLHERIAELEQRLARLEGVTGSQRRSPRRRRQPS